MDQAGLLKNSEEEIRTAIEKDFLKIGFVKLNLKSTLRISYRAANQVVEKEVLVPRLERAARQCRYG